jgi:hypothetical protein
MKGLRHPVLRWGRRNWLQVVEHRSGRGQYRRRGEALLCLLLITACWLHLVVPGLHLRKAAHCIRRAAHVGVGRPPQRIEVEGRECEGRRFDLSSTLTLGTQAKLFGLT